MEQIRDMLPENLWKTMVQRLGREEALRLLWTTAVGPKLARQTSLRQLRGRTLVVSVPDLQWTRSLLPLEKMILDSVNRFPDSWRAEAIEFVVEPHPSAIAPGYGRLRVAAAENAPRENVAGRNIADDRVQDAIVESEQKYFARPEESRK